MVKQREKIRDSLGRGELRLREKVLPADRDGLELGLSVVPMEQLHFHHDRYISPEAPVHASTPKITNNGSRRAHIRSSQSGWSGLSLRPPPTQLSLPPTTPNRLQCPGSQLDSNPPLNRLGAVKNLSTTIHALSPNLRVPRGHSRKPQVRGLICHHAVEGEHHGAFGPSYRGCASSWCM